MFEFVSAQQRPLMRSDTLRSRTKNASNQHTILFSCPPWDESKPASS